jgi:ornithine cyclodeaminase
MQIRILTKADVLRFVSMPAAIDAVQHAYASIARGTTDVPLRIDVAQAAHQSHSFFMPAIVDGQSLGMKIVSVFPQNGPRHGLPTIHAIVLLIDAATGVPKALMDGTELTILRTGAASGVGTRLLAREDSTHLVVIGAGAQAAGQIRAVCAVRPISMVTIVNRSLERATTLAAAMQREFPHIMVTATTERTRALATADIVCLATSSAVPVFADGDIRPGTHINGVGSYRHDMIEADPHTLARAYITVDQYAPAWSEAGELISARDAGLIRADSVVEIGAVANGDAPQRTGHDQITFFKSVGNAAQDVVVAQIAYDQACAAQLGTVVDV